MPALLVRYVGSLWLLQAMAGALALFLFDLRVVAVSCSLLFVALALGTARSLRRESSKIGREGVLGVALAVGLLWQLPGLLGTINQVRETLGLTEYDGNSDLLDFAMQTWQMALMPVLAYFPGRGSEHLAGYYIGLTVGPLVLAISYTLVAALPFRTRPGASLRSRTGGGGAKT